MSNSLISDELRYRLLKELDSNPDVSQRELAALMGISLGKTNYCLKALIAAGWVNARSFANPKHKLKHTYILTSKGLQEKTDVTIRYLKKKQLLYTTLEHEIKLLKQEVSAGRLRK